MTPQAKALVSKPQQRELDPGTHLDGTDFFNMPSDFTMTSCMRHAHKKLQRKD